MQVSAVLRGSYQKMTSFLKEVRVELSKVTWPSRAELKGQTIVVIVAVLMIAAFIGLVDTVLSNTIRLLVTRLG